jgi:DNA mismatch repair protein MutS
VINRASDVLAELENSSQTGANKAHMKPRQATESQLSFYTPKNEVVRELEQLDVDGLSPLEALTTLYKLQKKAKDD